MASSRLSVHSCRKMRPRLAPMATRMPISRSRVTARASIRPPRLAQATARISSVSTATMAATWYISGCMTCMCPPGEIWMYSLSQMSLGCWRRSSSVRARNSCSAVFAETPGASRPHILTAESPGSVSVAAFDKIRLLDHGHPDVGTLAAETGKCVRKHADDGGGLLVRVDDASDNGRIASEAALPESVTQHDGRRRVRIAVARGIEQAAEGCGRSQFGEVVGRDEGSRWLAEYRHRPACGGTPITPMTADRVFAFFS